MNNIYVDELPKNCEECPCCSFDRECGYSCNLIDLDIQTDYDINTHSYECSRQRHKDCPLKPLSDRLAEERKKVVQEIKDKISDGLYQNSYGETFIDGDIYEILDRIERGK